MLDLFRSLKAMLFLCLLLLGTISVTWRESAGADYAEDVSLSTVSIEINSVRFHSHWNRPLQVQLIAKHGYHPQTHRVTTVDGYILELHRISTVGGQPVIMMHGLLDSSATWVLTSVVRKLDLVFNICMPFPCSPIIYVTLCVSTLLYLQRTCYLIWATTYGWEMLAATYIRNITSATNQLAHDMNEKYSGIFLGMKLVFTICQPSSITFRRKRISPKCIISVIRKEPQHFSLWPPNVPNTMRKYYLWQH